MRLSALALLLATGCIEDPTDAALTLSADGATKDMPATIQADGVSLVALDVHAETDADVTLTASSGSFVGAGAGAPATLTVMTGRGTRRVEYRAGSDVGSVIVTASSGAFSSTTQVTLTPSLPTRLVLIPDRTSVTGDGVSFVELQTQALTTPPALVSHGAVLEYAVCCASADNQPVACETSQEPLTLPAVKQIDDGRQVTVRAVSTKVAARRTAFLLARVATTQPTFACGAMPGEVRSNSVRIDVVP
jgi:hypothetical protein